jgi:hypothetical protein
MAQVGMYKQQKYEEGVQKVQSYIDNIAGLDVVRDVDKQYLQSKLNQLGSKLKSVAAGDFSNFQLVNSVGGMATQVIKDPTVQNAVQSTAWYRKQLGEMEKAISEGKSSVENIYDFNEKANNWMSSTDLKQKFRDRYTPYIDIKKKAMETIKALHPKLQQYDIPFKIVDGKIDTRQIADAMKRYKIEGIDESQIKQALFATLTPDDFNQMSISAKYQFRGVSPEDLVRRAELNYGTQKKAVQEELKFLTEQRGVVSDPTELGKINNRIDYNLKLIGDGSVPGLLDEELKDNLELARTNPDGVKTSLYKDGFVKEFANAFGWKNQIESYETNPIRQQLNFVEKMKFDQQVENRRRYEFAENLKRTDQKILLDAEANALKKVELYGDPNASDWTPLGNPTDNALRANELFTNHVVTVGNAVNSDLAKLKTKYTDAQITEMLKDWEENGPKGTKIKSDAIGLLQSLSKNKNYLESLQEKEAKLRSDANAEVGFDIRNAVAGQKPRSITVKGKNFTLSPEEILGIETATSIESVDVGRGVYSRTAKVDKSRLNANQLAFVNSAEGAIYNVSSATSPKTLVSYFPEYEKSSSKYRDLANKAQDRYLSKLAPIAQEFVPQIKAVTTGKNGEPPPIIVSRLSQLLTSADINQIAADNNFDLSKASDMLLEENKKDTRVFIEQDGDNFKVHLKSEADPSNRQTLRLSRNDVVRYFGPAYVNNKTQESIRINVGGGNTNITGDPKRALLQKQFGDFPGITKYQVTADLNQDLSNPDLYTAMINVRKKDGRYASFEISGNNKLQRVGYDQGRQNLNSLTDLTLIKLLKENYPNYDFSNLDY